MSNNPETNPLKPKTLKGIHYKDFIDLLPIGILIIDIDAHILYANEQASKLTDPESRKLMGRDWRSLIHPDDAPPILQQWLDSVHSWKSFANTFRIYMMDGSITRVRMEAMLQYIPSLERNVYLCYFQQIGERKQNVTKEILGEMSHGENLYSMIVETVPIGLYGNDRDGKCIYINQRACELLDVTRKDCLLDGWIDRLHPEDSDRVLSSWKKAFSSQSAWENQYRLLHHDGTVIWVLARCVFTFDNQRNNNIGSIGSLTDITVQKELEENLEQINQKLQNLANLDGLTGIPNRRCFDEFLVEEWFRLELKKSPCSILMIDIDYFKAYNDTYGHVFGDKVLKTVAKAITKIVCMTKGLAARYGGEEFSVILSDIDAAQASKVADMILSEISALKIYHQGSKVSDRLTLSIGVSTVIPTIDRTPEVSIRESDIALYMAKKNGRNRIVIYSEDITKG